MQILVVVVRYKTPVEDSATLLSLAAQFEENPELSEACGVLIWDNSPSPLEDPRGAFEWQYQHSKSNRGVSGAYNGALEKAEAVDCPWLLLLDQDTSLPTGFLKRMLAYSHEVLGETEVATVVPFVYSHGQLVSPLLRGRFVRNHALDRARSGVLRQKAYAVNSGTLMRVASLREVGGYSEVFWLDLSDAYVFHLLHASGKTMYVAGDLEVPHSIASMDFDAGMSVERYRSFLAAESLFIERCRSGMVNAFYTLWLLPRSLRQMRRYRNKNFARTTLDCLRYRLLHGREAREAHWQRELRFRDIPAIADGRVVD